MRTATDAYHITRQPRAGPCPLFLCCLSARDAPDSGTVAGFHPSRVLIMPHAGCLSSLEPTAPFSPMVLHLRVNNLKSICSPPPPLRRSTAGVHSLSTCPLPLARIPGLASLPGARRPHLALLRVTSFVCPQHVCCVCAAGASAASAPVLPSQVLPH